MKFLFKNRIWIFLRIFFAIISFLKFQTIGYHIYMIMKDKLAILK